jgi:gamma-glutamylcyclotransferase (GGCT)/AIG2-like uncharacterized protein YtfP
VADLVFFYGTLMTGFDRRRRAGIEGKLAFRGRGWIHAQLFDLGIYPAAIPAPDNRVWGEVYEMIDASTVLRVLDEIEGHTPAAPEQSLYVRQQVPVAFDDGAAGEVWVYFYNAPLGRAPQIASGDYLDHVRVR